jgi:hypothetical protein
MSNSSSRQVGRGGGRGENAQRRIKKRLSSKAGSNRWYVRREFAICFACERKIGKADDEVGAVGGKN